MLKRFIKRSLPDPLISVIRSYNNRQYSNLSTEQIFTKIYEGGVWGKDPVNPFYSGSGSNKDDEVAAYRESVIPFLRSFAVKPDVVDLGCGDFTVGSQVRNFCNRYVACDVVPSLIAFNKARFADLDVQFKALDIIEDELPPGSIAFVRQVLQHLSNDQISRFVSRAALNYKFLIVTEHLPSDAKFKHNTDKLAGPGTRMGHDSGVVLTSPPFNLRPQTERQLCRINSVDTGVLVTTLYGL
jgi:hypothetical protein